MFSTKSSKKIILNIKNNTDSKLSTLSFFFENNSDVKPVLLKNLKPNCEKKTYILTVNSNNNDLKMSILDHIFLIRPEITPNSKSTLFITIDQLNDGAFGITVKEIIRKNKS